MAERPRVSVVVPASNEADQLPGTLASLDALRTVVAFEVIVVDGDSTDGTASVAESAGVRVVHGDGHSRARGRNRGARAAAGAWLAFVDADTRVRPRYLDAMLAAAHDRDLAAVSSRCRVVGPRRGLAMEVVVNRVFPHLRRPILPGFNFFVERAVFDAVGGFPEVGNEDTALSRRLGASYRTGYHPDPLVETSGRRFADQGLTGSLAHYLALDVDRVRADY